MAFISRLALVLFAVIVIVPASSLLYVMLVSAVTAGLLGIENEGLNILLYLICWAGGIGTAIYVVCKLWAKAERPPREKSDYDW